MLVKKAPINKELCHFFLTPGLALNSPEFCVFFDIETTGLSSKNSVLYLIGAVKWEDSGWCLYQWFAETPQEEPELLEEFSSFLPPRCTLIHYNGQRFDIPYLKDKYASFGLSDPFPPCHSLDLYRICKPLKHFLGLEHMRQRDLEEFLGIRRPDQNTGKDCIKIYRDLIKYRDTPAYSPPLLCHNQWDLEGLLQLPSLMAYFPLMRGEFQAETARIARGTFQAQVLLPLPLPKKITCQDSYLSLTAQDTHAWITLPLPEGRLRQYYKNYKDYCYFPAEDTALHKSVAAFTEKSHRTPATPQTCYTKFPCTQEFCQDLPKVTTYLKNLLPLLLT